MWFLLSRNNILIDRNVALNVILFLQVMLDATRDLMIFSQIYQNLYNYFCGKLIGLCQLMQFFYQFSWTFQIMWDTPGIPLNVPKTA